MKKSILFILTLFSAVSLAFAADSKPFYRAGEYGLAAFAAAKTSDGECYEGAAGLVASYFISRNIGFEAYGLSYDTEHGFVDQCGLSLVGRLPINRSAFAPYFYAGPGYDFESSRWDLHQGLGAELRFTPNIGIFADAGWFIPNNREDYGLFRAGLKLVF